MDYKGDIIEESLKNKDTISRFTVTRTRIETVTEKHKTPWLQKWTLHTVTIPEKQAGDEAEQLSHEIETLHNSWYIDFRNDTCHYIIFPGKVFKINRKNPSEYEAARDYGIRLGIPKHQLNW